MGKVIVLKGQDPPHWVIDLTDIKDRLKEDIESDYELLLKYCELPEKTIEEYYNDRLKLRALKEITKIKFNVVVINQLGDEEYT